MCEAVGETPNEDEMPIEFEDLPLEVQEALIIYGKLPDKWDQMSGSYLGKDLISLIPIYDVYNIDLESRPFITDIIRDVDSARQEVIEKNNAAKQSAVSKPPQ